MDIDECVKMFNFFYKKKNRKLVALASCVKNRLVTKQSKMHYFAQVPRPGNLEQRWTEKHLPGTGAVPLTNLGTILVRTCTAAVWLGNNPAPSYHINQVKHPIMCEGVCKFAMFPKRWREREWVRTTFTPFPVREVQRSAHGLRTFEHDSLLLLFEFSPAYFSLSMQVATGRESSERGVSSLRGKIPHTLRLSSLPPDDRPSLG